MLTFIINGCVEHNNSDSKEKWKSEIIQTEKDFSAMALKEGIPKAFLKYADEDAVLMRNNVLISGKQSISDYFNSKSIPSNKVTLEWNPDFVDVSSSGDLAYSYGKYIFMVTDSIGNTNKSEGIFHTVWKRQEDDSWRFVWD